MLALHGAKTLRPSNIWSLADPVALASMLAGETPCRQW